MRTLYLTDDDLGRLDLSDATASDCGPYICTEFQLGFPTVREVVRLRALADGAIDDSAYLGPRALSATLRVDQRKGDPQTLIDAVMPYMLPRRRPRIHWSLPGSLEERSAIVRGADAPLAVTGPKYHGLVLQWLAPGGIIEGSSERCLTIAPGLDTEDGRTYDLTFDRTYPFSLGLGDRIITTNGTAVADWQATIYGDCTDPAIRVNDATMSFDQNGGVVLTPIETIVIDTKERTVLRNGDPSTPLGDRINFTDWSWEDLRLQPGENLVRYSAAALGAASQATICWRDAYL